MKSFPIRILLTLSWLAAAHAASPKAERPNVIVIVSDNHGYRDLGCFGSPEVLSPNLDRLAQEGVKATQFYNSSGCCTPARGSILTGRYPQRNGLYDMIRNDMVDYRHRFTMAEYAVSPEMTMGLDLREITLGNLMQGAGYVTAAIGKWDSGRARRFRPLQRGFDSYFGFLASGADYVTGERYGIPSTYRNNELITQAGYSEELFTQEALGFIHQNRDRNFFLYLAYHTPAGNPSLDTKDRRLPKKYLELYPGKDPQDPRTQYMALISCMDQGIGEIMSTLRNLGLEQNTLVIFFPDNGQRRGHADNGLFRADDKQDDQLGEGGIRTSFIARWPGVIPAGRSTDAFLSSLEIFPTLAAVAGVRPPAGVVLDGFNMIPVLQGKIPSPRSEMFWQSRNGRAAHVGKYKWAETPAYRGLFDLEADPGEANDLSAAQPERLAFVKSRWEVWRREMDAAEPRGPFRDY